MQFDQGFYPFQLEQLLRATVLFNRLSRIWGPVEGTSVIIAPKCNNVSISVITFGPKRNKGPICNNTLNPSVTKVLSVKTFRPNCNKGRIVIVSFILKPVICQRQIVAKRHKDWKVTWPCENQPLPFNVIFPGLTLLSNYTYTHSSVPRKVLGKRQRPLKLKMRPLPLRNID